MEGNKIYEDSYNELIKARKNMSNSIINIDLDNLDAITKEKITLAVSSVLEERISAIEKVILGVQ
jgi:hypothetical protein